MHRDIKGNPITLTVPLKHLWSFRYTNSTLNADLIKSQAQHKEI